MTDVLFPVTSLAVLVLTALGIAWRIRDDRWVRDAQLALNARPRLSLISVVFLMLSAAALVIIGVASLGASFTPGWGFVPLALEALLIASFIAWIARRKFPTD